jgi:hypothetical protein
MLFGRITSRQRKIPVRSCCTIRYANSLAVDIASLQRNVKDISAEFFAGGDPELEVDV